MTTPDERRARIEGELLEEELEALGNIVTALGRPLRTWPRVPWLRIWVETTAVENLTMRLQGDGRREPAEVAACSRLGVPLTTHRRRRQRAREHAFDPDRDPSMTQSVT